ncbi:hypothetical protein KKG19_01035 [Patescibacteria group bacterium]|nr:hypothetical protein [Patescibacteria group bacterium]
MPMYDWLKRGVVESFSPQSGQGRIRGEDGVEYFFHRDALRRLVAGYTQPVFRPHDPILEPTVQVGDALVFRPGFTANGPKAEIWGFASHYERADQEIAARQVKQIKVAS